MSDKVYIVNESTKRSIVTDIVVFSILVGSFWFNHQFLGDGVILQIVLGICFFISIIARATSSPKKMSVDEARKYFCEDKEEQ